MKRTPEHVQTRLAPEQHKAIVNLARRQYDGNVSMATRRVIAMGLRVVDQERKVQQAA